MRHLVLAAAAALVVMGGGARAAEPRAVVGRVADQIAANYYDPARGPRSPPGSRPTPPRGPSTATPRPSTSPRR
ncbi:hypothetical protein [Phenylobacterium sp. J367]|uniref:hypothetical protein n=1 Tax=Phenylobacterium sp. J367 TaxID=2898435 RepID=UPI0021517608|nr:hypothetical protein [Phenylobacterium sp. J367]MCR5878012.1 hypothetical protein [Phenylobacterium sp. J367]